MSALRVTAALSAALLMGCLLEGCASGPRTVKAASLKPDKDRHVAPDFALKDADGRTVHLAEYKGKVVLLDFWATWCGPCRVEIPWFIDIERKNKDKGFAVLGVSMDENGWEDVKPFLAEMDLALGAATGPPNARRSACATGCAGTRRATFGKPLVAKSGTISLFRSTSVNGPGQKCCASSRAAVGICSARSKA